MDERVLPDDYPVNAGYLYVADGKVVEAYITGDVKRLKSEIGADEIRRCDIEARRKMAGK